ncbi:MAG: SelL-related redox protein [Microscillaceae bacterium]|nr:SelL-related redox protein [Microscillaceae bacterium]MDW8460084.1 SelL-related redox protein [Cytophagales bacterium]
MEKIKEWVSNFWSILQEKYLKIQKYIQNISQKDDKRIAEIPNWVLPFISIASYYNIVWGLFILMYPTLFLQFFNPEIQQAPLTIYFFALLLLALGVGLYFVRLAPFRFSLILIIGVLIKIASMLGTWLISDEYTNQEVLIFYTILNDLIWIPLLLVSFYHIFRAWQNTEEDFFVPLPYILHNYETNYGSRLIALTQEKPVLLIFLRHLGCTFCRETLSEIAEKRTEIEKQAHIVFVHMADLETATAYFENYRLQGIEHISDVSCGLYRAFRLERGKFGQIFGLKAIWRGFQAGILKKHGIGKLIGDGFRMPGVFLVYQGEVLKEFIYQSVADRPDYQELATCPIPLS